MVITKLRLGTRKSPLALKQSDWVKAQIVKKYPLLEVKIIKIKTYGDKLPDKPLREFSKNDMFIKEIEEALLKEEIDIGVHSMKDVPVTIPDELCIAAITEREDPRDVLISKRGKLKELPHNSIVGTSSLRRKAQILNSRKDLLIKDIRGNVDTRLKKLENEDYDAIVLAAAGLIRLGLKDKITEYISTDIMLPDAGQGALGIETRNDDTDIQEFVSFLNNRESLIAVSAERVFTKKIGASCRFPVAAYGEVLNKKLKLTGLVATKDGKKVIRDSMEGEINSFEEIGIRLAEKLLENGGKEILRI
ncbi:MAG: hydroxymethylbilane synthase [Candidatus Schekmanbacteria bacterium RIFCSPHIGHO2_02_FULL_38_11]|uniref:Porphobilinogen deaminase n=1 Tax=Candidatus Schekmanbacteria bacterium RIFCSPLOWO2_12_FULL_38_15 TaxID=1817883 RepID=A0A1F7SID3_9BACT|nr:MAG: hydroxymethylbilane synthase [Candidatus Schekmanbacteria bacterium GWA2_38_9]OGL49645.1 MAG: hydroxymethylbilane synthase [Candidatus Schekmanbacteria bacterium RIFCSPLOWO2_02_FULL_38_14]OGL50367.1 MAG: hydroxymethylbilane synthase [Candidatus Schekmanbacteria bacterium RIFCSPHIGHO2_02_FULL_38_11]OGL52998.1 MAG: hydroxymethylbilane synthase [Candidatus Schekmanbacteria bacterium RIFCSPLOWO2_12_FULL_38_15]